MSVAPSAAKIPPFLIPARLKAKYRAATGDDTTAIWSHGDGPFENSSVNDSLKLMVTSPVHGVLSPKEPVPIGDYQAALAATQAQWQIDE